MKYQKKKRNIKILITIVKIKYCILQKVCIIKERLKI